LIPGPVSGDSLAQDRNLISNAAAALCATILSVNPQRQLGLASATALVVANMIGTGVFTTSGLLLADLRSPWIVLLAWAVGGVISTCGALSYGALARRIPESGGEYLFLSRTLHPAAGYLAGWVSLLVGFSAPLAAAAFAFGEYSRTWLTFCHPRVSGSLLVIAFSLLHAASVHRGAAVQNAAVVIKIAVILLFIGFAPAPMPSLGETAGPFPFASFGVSLAWISFSYSGWNAAVYIGGEVRDPERNLPRALLIGTLLVTSLYLALNAVFVFAAPVDQLAGRLDVARIAGEHLGGPVLANAVSALVALVLVSSISAMVMAGPRVYARMAGDGYLPGWLRPENGPPRAAIYFQGGLAVLLLWTATFEGLLTYIGFTLGLSTAATVFGLVRLRCRAGATLRVPGWPWVPALFLVSVLGTTIFSVARRPFESLLGALTLGIGWLAWRTNRSGGLRQ
jgi:APA family basic amino acid/polyamine antiporter